MYSLGIIMSLFFVCMCVWGAVQLCVTTSGRSLNRVYFASKFPGYGHFVPGHFVPGHFVPGQFIPGHFVPRLGHFVLKI